MPGRKTREKKGQYTGAWAILNYNPIIDDNLAFTRSDIMNELDTRHRQLFPEKYDKKGKLLDEFA